MIILLHSSKTMRAPATKTSEPMTQPQLMVKAIELDTYLRTLSPFQLAKVMAISKPLADKTHALIATWSAQPTKQRPAIDSFLGDIYSGLQVATWGSADRKYANKTLRILSGLYGILRPLDGIYPYRLEMGYKLPNQKFSNLYRYWGKTITNTLPDAEPIINLSAVEYSKTITPFVDSSQVITPRFLTVSPKTNEPTFVTVHTKIARGAFAAWLITSKAGSVSELSDFMSIGYRYNKTLSNPNAPVFVCKEFGGKGLSMRLK